MKSDEHQEDTGEFVLPLILQIDNGRPRVIGTCVIIAVAKRHALAFTARHVVQFMFDLIDDDRLKELKVAPHFQKIRFGERFSDGGRNSTLDKRLKLQVSRGSDKAKALVTGLSYFPGRDLDIALLSLELEERDSRDFVIRCPIASRGAFLNERVVICGYPSGEITSFDKANKLFQIQITRKKAWARVSAHLDWDEDYFVRSPGMVLDAGSPPGFSGGPVLMKSDLLKSPVLVGIISSSDDVTTKASLIWPALPLNHQIRHNGTVPETVLGLLSLKGAITDLSNAASHIYLNENATSLREYVTWRD